MEFDGREVSDESTPPASLPKRCREPAAPATRHLGVKCNNVVRIGNCYKSNFRPEPGTQQVRGARPPRHITAKLPSIQDLEHLEKRGSAREPITPLRLP